MQIEGAHVWDFRFVSLQIGLAAGPALLLQRFDTNGVAPGRQALAGTLATGLGAETPLGGRFALTVSAVANVYAFKQRDAADQDSAWTMPVTFATRLGLAARW